MAEPESNKRKQELESKVQETAVIVEDALRSIADRMEEIFEEAAHGASTLVETTIKDFEKDMKKTYRDLGKEMNAVTEKAIQGGLKQNDIAKVALERKQTIVALETKRIILARQMGLAKGEENEVTQELLDNINKIKAAEEGVNELLKDQYAVSKKISNAMGITGHAIKTASGWASKLGISGLDEAFENASTAAKDMAFHVTDGGKQAAGFGGKLKVAGAAMKEIGKGLLEVVTDPVVWITLLVKAFTELKKLVFEFSESSVKLGREFGLAKEAAVELDSSLRSMATSSTYLHAELKEAFVELNQAAGTFTDISLENLETYVELTKNLGISKELAFDFYKIAEKTGRTVDQVAKTEYERVNSLKQQEGLAVNVMSVYKEMGNASASIKLNLGAVPGALAQASFYSKALGLDLAKVDSIASSLLNFESSIQSEMEAELLTGRQLNFEKARLYAINNDLAGVAKEITAQGITAEKYTRMNRIQQESLAKAIGMSRDDMSEMLMKQELIKEGVLKEEKTTFEQMKKNVSLQEKWNRMVAKMKEYFVDAISPTIEKIVNWLSNTENFKSIQTVLKSAADSVAGLIKGIQEFGITKTLIGGVIGGVGIMAIKAALTAKVASGLTPVTPSFAYVVNQGMGGGGGRMAKGGMMNTLPGGSRYGAAMRASQMGKFGLSRGMGGAMGMGAAAGFGLAGAAVQWGGNELAGSFEESGNMAAAQTTDVVSGMGQGALYGAALGSIVPGIGTAAGAIVGGAIGLISGGLEAADRSSSAREKERKEEEDKKKAEEEKKANQGNEMLKIMMELNYNVKAGKEIKMDGNKVGTATAMADYYIQ